MVVAFCTSHVLSLKKASLPEIPFGVVTSVVFEVNLVQLRDTGLGDQLCVNVDDGDHVKRQP